KLKNFGFKRSNLKIRSFHGTSLKLLIGDLIFEKSHSWIKNFSTNIPLRKLVSQKLHLSFGRKAKIDFAFFDASWEIFHNCLKSAHTGSFFFKKEVRVSTRI